QRDTAIEYGGRLVMKVLRRAAAGINPGVEISRFLIEKKSFSHVAPLVGALEYHPRRSEAMTLAVLHSYVPSERTAWQYSLDELGLFFERVLALPAAEQQAPMAAAPLLELVNQELPSVPSDLFDTYGESLLLLGRRTAELHL